MTDERIITNIIIRGVDVLELTQDYEKVTWTSRYVVANLLVETVKQLHNKIKENYEYIEAIRDIYEIVKGDYNTLDPQAKKDIENIITNIAKKFYIYL